MRTKSAAVLICLFTFWGLPLFAQTHSSVPLEDGIYYILEQAEARGLCAPLSGVKPYARRVVLAAISDILASEKINDNERTILETYRNRFSKPKSGLDWRRGAFYAETSFDKKAAPAKTEPSPPGASDTGTALDTNADL